VLTDLAHGIEQAVLLRVLLVEDDSAFVEFFSTSLETIRSGLQLTVARRLSAALAALADTHYDAILLDLNLPDSEGLLTLRRVALSAPEMPIVVFTGLDEGEQAQEALRLGAEDWLTKGDSQPQLVVRAIRYAVERKRLTNSLVRLQKLEAVGRLAGSVAHEFNNVLTAIVGNAAFAESTADAEARSGALREIQQAAMRGALLTRQLLGVSRPRVASPASADVKSVVAAVQGLFQAVLPRRIALRVAVMDTLRVQIAPEHLEQILLNLLLNARDAIAAQGVIEIDAHRIPPPVDADFANYAEDAAAASTASWVRLEVHDTGHGIPTAELPRIFESFFTTKGRAGTGLGLAICKELVEHAGGRIHAESRAGEGATLIVDLPEVVVTSMTPGGL
jgi:signal transduction histidine kinase